MERCVYTACLNKLEYRKVEYGIHYRMKIILLIILNVKISEMFTFHDGEMMGKAVWNHYFDTVTELSEFVFRG